MGSPSAADWVREAEQWVLLDALLPTLLKGEAEPASPEAGLQFARLCLYKRRYGEAIMFYTKAFAAKPALAEDTSAGNRYNAACAAALAGCGKGEDAAANDSPARVRWREQARGWLRADLALWTQKIGDAKPEDRAAAAKTVKHWQEDTDLAGVRDKDALAKLPADEQDAWRKLWADVDALLKKTGDGGQK
jgi:eukaryotic-like serine/threonine-protein kinase